MPGPLLNFNDWISVPWAEFIGRDGSHGASWTSSFSPNNRATFEIVVNWEDALQAELDILGNAFFDPGKGLLSRTLPAEHPIKPWMLATQLVHTQPLAWDEKLDSFVTAAQGTMPGESAVSAYRWMHMVFGFETPLWNTFLNDTELQSLGGGEWQRFCIVKKDYSEECVSTETGSWLWADGTGGVHPTPKVKITAPVPILFPHHKIHIKWCRLPRAGLYGDLGASDLFNSNLENSYGKVNNNPAFFDSSANANTGRLRLIGLESTPYPSPFAPSIQGLAPGDCNQFYDLDLVFDFFDPPAGNPNNRGWNTRPFRGDNQWWLAQTEPPTPPPDVPGNTMFPMADLSLCFQLSKD